MTTLLTMKGFNKQAQPVTTAGIYHSPNLWLISLSSDWTNWITIADKNLWATQVYNDGDTLSEANCGKYFQWWNNYGFPFTWAVTTSNTRVNAQNYWPWNYYSSSTFITIANWDNSNNINLWWGTTWTNTAMQWPCASGYHIATDNEQTNLINTMTALWINTSNWECIKEYLKMPFAGRLLYSSGIPISVDVDGCYFSSIWYSTNLAYWIQATDSAITLAWRRRWEWNPIRPFANTSVQPDDSRTVLYPTN